MLFHDFKGPYGDEPIMSLFRCVSTKNFPSTPNFLWKWYLVGGVGFFRFPRALEGRGLCVVCCCISMAGSSSLSSVKGFDSQLFKGIGGKANSTDKAQFLQKNWLQIWQKARKQIFFTLSSRCGWDVYNQQDQCVIKQCGEQCVDILAAGVDCRSQTDTGPLLLSSCWISIEL